MKQHLPAIEETNVKPFIGGVFDAEDVADAHRTLEEKKAKGKVLTPLLVFFTNKPMNFRAFDCSLSNLITFKVLHVM